MELPVINNIPLHTRRLLRLNFILFVQG